jgi:hypothetical protein
MIACGLDSMVKVSPAALVTLTGNVSGAADVVPAVVEVAGQPGRKPGSGQSRQQDQHCG